MSLPIDNIICGDCLEVMRDWPDACVDAIVTDPPYSSGGQFRGDRMQTTNAKYIKTDSRATYSPELAAVSAIRSAGRDRRGSSRRHPPAGKLLGHDGDQMTERMKLSRCYGCGRCCRNLLLEVSGMDLMREPRLAEYAQRMKDIDYKNWEAEPDRVTFLLPSPCPFLKDNQCSIYPTRPNLCVVFRAVHNKRCVASPKCVFSYKFAGA